MTFILVYMYIYIEYKTRIKSRREKNKINIDREATPNSELEKKHDNCALDKISSYLYSSLNLTISDIDKCV